MKLVTFFALFALRAWGGYALQRTITIDHTRVGSTDSSNFTIVVSGTYSFLRSIPNGGDIWNVTPCGANGGDCPADLVFASDSACQSPLSWEIETYSPATGLIVVWINVPLLSHTANTVLYACYSNAAVTTFHGGAVGAAWDAASKGVYHFPNGSVLTAYDSTGANDGVITAATAVPGRVGGGAGFDGNIGRVQASGTGTLNFTGSVTMAAWVYPRAVAYGTVIAKSRDYAFFLSGDGTSSVYLSFTSCGGGPGNISISSPWTLNSWNHMVVTEDNSFARIYLNGTLVGTRAGACQASSQGGRFNMGSENPGTNALNGNVDEVRVASTIRSVDWITAEYNNQNNPSNFYTVGTAIGLDSGAAPISGLRGSQPFID